MIEKVVNLLEHKKNDCIKQNQSLNNVPLAISTIKERSLKIVRSSLENLNAIEDPNEKVNFLLNVMSNVINDYDKFLSLIQTQATTNAGKHTALSEITDFIQNELERERIKEKKIEEVKERIEAGEYDRPRKIATRPEALANVKAAKEQIKQEG